MTTNLATDAIGPELHRRLGIDLYNHSRRLLEIEGRTVEQDAELIHTAHASCHHWRQVGTAANRARGEWLLARVYSVLGRPEPALYHARRCLALAERGGDGFEDWDLPAAHEAMKKKVPQSVGECFELIEREFFVGPWVLGERYGVGDMYLFTLAQWLEGDGVDAARFPKVSAHRERMRADPAVRRVMAAEAA